MNFEDESGFTLIEAIVALAISSLALTVFYGALSDGIYQKNRLSQRALAATTAVYHVRRLELEGHPAEEYFSRSHRPAQNLTWHHQLAPITTSNHYHETKARVLSLKAEDLDGHTLFELNTLVRQP